ncbi:hypothetical protein GJ496_006625 [Pomphorhynchus laevis]|nr:hypothetical protein GJ496_006625 [Pomphorhynchus laevis]
MGILRDHHTILIYPSLSECAQFEGLALNDAVDLARSIRQLTSSASEFPTRCPLDYDKIVATVGRSLTQDRDKSNNDIERALCKSYHTFTEQCRSEGCVNGAAAFYHLKAPIHSINVIVNGIYYMDLIYTGSSKTVVFNGVRCNRPSNAITHNIIHLGGRLVQSVKTNCRIRIDFGCFDWQYLRSQMKTGFILLIGMDLISQIGGVHINGEGMAKFENTSSL